MQAGDTQTTSPGATLSPACGLYCGVCADYVAGQCHGCGCACGACAGQAHVDHCAIVKCVRERNLESCADCDELPCTRVIQFTNDPIWTTHSVCIENLRRRKRIGTDRWMLEQEHHWSDERRRKTEVRHHDECARRWRAWNSDEQS